MKILIVSCVDDNFGDNLIRICFEKLLCTVLCNLKVSDSEYEIARMGHKQINRDLICSSDLVFFAGGGMFGLNYMNNFVYLDEIISLADQQGIPVVFSSIGVNNMDATPENEHVLSEMLARKCFRAVSVRENPELFRRYAAGCDYEIVEVCDPAVWAKYIYHSHLSKLHRPLGETVIGINAVRGGLFGDNGKPWKLGDEMNYFNELKKMLDEAGMRYYFYTNGSFLDNNSLLYYAKENDIPAERVIIPKSTRELVETVYQFTAVAAIRMHSSIISYALDIPSVNLVWNDKIPFFYQNIHYPERAVQFDKWNAQSVFDTLASIGNDPDYHTDKEYLMTLYDFLYDTMSGFFPQNAQSCEKYDFARVRTELINNPVTLQEDIDELLIKVQKGEKHYLSRFTEMKKKDKEFRQLKKDNEKKDKEIKKLKAEISKLNNLKIVKLRKMLGRIIKKAKCMFIK